MQPPAAMTTKTRMSAWRTMTPRAALPARLLALSQIVLLVVMAAYSSHTTVSRTPEIEPARVASSPFSSRYENCWASPGSFTFSLLNALFTTP